MFLCAAPVFVRLRIACNLHRAGTAVVVHRTKLHLTRDDDVGAIVGSQMSHRVRHQSSHTRFNLISVSVAFMASMSVFYTCIWHLRAHIFPFTSVSIAVSCKIVRARWQVPPPIWMHVWKVSVANTSKLLNAHVCTTMSAFIYIVDDSRWYTHILWDSVSYNVLHRVTPKTRYRCCWQFSVSVNPDLMLE